MNIRPKLAVQIDDELGVVAEACGVSREEFRAQFKDKTLKELRSTSLYQQQLAALRELARKRKAISMLIEKTLNPSNFSIPVVLRRVQSAALHALAKSFRRYNRGFLDMPTGSGKTMVMGAQIRAILEWAKKNNILDQVEVLILTSRINLASQMIAETYTDDSENYEEDLLNIGDIQLWIKDICEDVRMITGSSKEDEKNKNSPVTVMTYQGLREDSLEKYFEKNNRKIALVIADECHNITDRVRLFLQNQLGNAFLTGYSATPVGPDRNPYNVFEDLVYRESLREMIERGELKQVRVIRVNTDIDMSDVDIVNGKFVQTAVERIIASNKDVLQDLVLQTLQKPYPVLVELEEKPLIDRQSLFFVTRIQQAEDLAKALNTIGMSAVVLSGETPERIFEQFKSKFKKGEIKAIVSARKITEGFDVENVEAVHMLQPLGEGSSWLYKQEIGRGLRLDSSNPFASCIIIDYLYTHTKHLPFSAHEALELSEYREAALLVPSGMRDVEMKVLTMRCEGKTFAEIYNLLSDEEKVCFMRLTKVVPEHLLEKMRLGGIASSENTAKIGIILNNIEVLEEIKRRVDLNIFEEDREYMKQVIRNLLKEKNVYNKSTLLHFGSKKFFSTFFGAYGSGITLGGKILGGSLPPSLWNMKTLEKIADELYGEETEEQRITMLRNILGVKGIKNKDDLLAYGSVKFTRTDFPPFDKGMTLASMILGNKAKRSITHGTLSMIAEILFAPDEESEVDKYKRALSENGILCRKDLLNFGIIKFTSTSFGHYGKGRKFATAVLKRKFHFVDLNILSEVADVVFGKETNEQKIEEYRKAIEINGIRSRSDLLNFGVNNFRKAEFQPFGKAYRFTCLILGRDIRGLGFKEMIEIADILFGPEPVETKDQKIARFRRALLYNNISTKDSFLAVGSMRFRTLDFPPFGKGITFVSRVLGIRLYNLNNKNLEDAARILFE